MSITKSVLILLPGKKEYFFGFFLEERLVGEHEIINLYEKPPETSIYEIALANLTRLSEMYNKYNKELVDHTAHIARDAANDPYVCFVYPSKTEEGAIEIATNWSILTVHHLLTGEDFNEAGDPKEIAKRHSMKIEYGEFVETDM